MPPRKLGRPATGRRMKNGILLRLDDEQYDQLFTLARLYGEDSMPKFVLRIVRGFISARLDRGLPDRTGAHGGTVKRP